MKQVQFYDSKDQPLIINDEQAEALRAHIPTSDWVVIDGNMYAVKSIKSVVDAPSATQFLGTRRLADGSQMPGSTAEISEEQKKLNLKKIRKMKADFLNRSKS